MYFRVFIVLVIRLERRLRSERLLGDVILEGWGIRVIVSGV